MSRADDVGEHQRSSEAGKTGADGPGHQTSAIAVADPAPSPKRKPGPPKVITDMRAYKAEKERQRRAKQKQKDAPK